MQRKVNVALGGGGVRGVAHLGVVQCLLDHDYLINGISGTSAGGLFGSMIAAGHSPREIVVAVDNFFTESSFRVSFGYSSFSLLGTAGIVKSLEPFLKGKMFEDLTTPFAATAVSLRTGQETIIKTGDVMQAILATIAIPGFFPSHGDQVLVDGGLIDPIPVDSARQFDPTLPIVAITLHKRPPGFTLQDIKVPLEDSLSDPFVKTVSKTKLGEFMRHLTASVDVVSGKLSELQLEVAKPDVLVEPVVGHIGLLQKVDANSLFDEGYRAMEEKLEALEKSYSLINSFRRISKYSRSGA
ncbi:MAG TPA: patatin-like phospholipase family protein [Anaerolineaceae bacterium]|nr:patatin-like phospholipase family protein [Anaerolineaceae bacterium]